jgi:glycosyltransferase involved in cell wall biosynthesis
MASSLYAGDRYLRTLLPGEQGLRGVWARAMKAHNRRLGLDPSRPHRAAISWASNALREHVELPSFVEPALERTIHPATTQEAAFSAVERTPDATPSFLYLGRMTTAKGIEVAYRALASLRNEHGLDARLVQVGTAKPEMLASLAGLAAELGIGDAIDDRGRLETDELSVVLAQVGALVLPTVEWDVFPLVLIEAGLARVPIVAARIGGVPEAVTDGEHAILFEPGNVDACAAALATVFREPEAAAERARRAYERMQSLSVARYREESERFLVEAAEALS